MNLVSVARGTSEAYFEEGLHAWDVAAGDLLVREAGGHVDTIYSGDFCIDGRQILAACNADVAKDIKMIIK